MTEKGIYKQFSITDALTVLFVGLKMTGHIDWGWFWVVLPWISTMIYIYILLFIRELKEGY